MLQTFATFGAICVLWSFWTSESLAEWLSLWSAIGGRFTLATGHLIVPVVAVIIVAGVLRAERGRPRPARNRRAPRGHLPGMRLGLATAASLAALLALGVEQVLFALRPPKSRRRCQSLRSGRLSRLDNAKLERGYYESLLQVDRFNSQLWEVYMKKPAELARHRGTARSSGSAAILPRTELSPSFSFATNYGHA